LRTLNGAHGAALQAWSGGSIVVLAESWIALPVRSTLRRSFMKKILSLLAVGAAVLASPVAQAQGYVGFGAGPSRINIDCTGADTCDKTDTGFKLYGGMRVQNQLAIEGVYFDWGKARATATVVDTGTGELKVKANGFGVGVTYFIPFMTNWSCVGRLGIARNKGDTTATLNGASASDSFTGTFPYYGFGCGYGVTPNLVVTGEADFSRVKYTDQDKANVQLLSIGLRYSF
jgi:OOP family OmpA-OmpF porin